MSDTKKCQFCGEDVLAVAVKCKHCGEMLTAEGAAAAAAKAAGPDELSTTEWVVFSLAFLFIPCVNVLISSALYYAWRGSRPNRANQINRLGFAVFFLQIVLNVGLGALTARH
jgi:hypothetical protein